MTGYLHEFATLAGVHLLAVASPGPDFAMVARQSIAWGRGTAVRTSLGIGLGILFHSVYCLLGLGLLLTRSGAAFNVVKFLGAGYLVWIGVASFRSTTARADAPAGAFGDRPSAVRAILAGFLTNALNPKAAFFFLALFSVVVSAQTPLAARAAYCAWMAVATFAWFAGVSCYLSRDDIRRKFLAMGPWVGRVEGTVFILLAARLALASAR
jgi:RhtB (resistance to homoserine/threonine) family protein